MLLKTSDLVTLKFVTSFREYHWLLFRWCTSCIVVYEPICGKYV